LTAPVAPALNTSPQVIQTGRDSFSTRVHCILKLPTPNGNRRENSNRVAGRTPSFQLPTGLLSCYRLWRL
jgi:hypothetical protein